jgi:hypothetical protein
VGVRMGLNALIRGPFDSVMVPVPQYPLYSASVALYDGNFVGYQLDEATGWSMDIETLQATAGKAAAEGKRVRGLVFINPGNPTGQCLTEDTLKDLIKFAVDNEIVLMADEVYQPNIYQDEKPFVSARCGCCATGGCSAHWRTAILQHSVSWGRPAVLQHLRRNCEGLHAWAMRPNALAGLHARHAWPSCPGRYACTACMALAQGCTGVMRLPDLHARSACVGQHSRTLPHAAAFAAPHHTSGLLYLQDGVLHALPEATAHMHATRRGASARGKACGVMHECGRCHGRHALVWLTCMSEADMQEGGGCHGRAVREPH